MATRIKRTSPAWIKQDGLCKYCEDPMHLPEDPDYCKSKRATWDHVIPRAKGGIGLHNNRVLACYSCNRDKADMSLDEFQKSKICDLCGKKFKDKNSVKKHRGTSVCSKHAIARDMASCYTDGQTGSGAQNEV